MKVIVVGLGIAGCRAAQLLAQNGVEVLALEANSHIGGRLRTLEFAPNAIWEGGGEWIDAEHVRALNLLDGLGIAPLQSHQYPGILMFQNESAREDEPWPDANQDRSHFYEIAQTNLDRLKNNDALLDLQPRSVRDMIEASAQSDRGRWYLEATIRSDEGDDTRNIGYVPWLRGQLLYADRMGDEMSAFRTPVGWQMICERLLARDGITVETDVNIEEICVADQVQVRSASRQYACDHAVIAIDANALKDIVIRCDDSMKIKEAASHIKMGTILKFGFYCEPASLDGAGQLGRVLSDQWIQQVWESNAGGAHILSGYRCGAGWENPASDVSRAIRDVEQLSAGITIHRENVQVCRWENSGFSHLPPGCSGLELLPLRVSHGKLHFAGEHTAVWSGFIEGALESAERVVSEIL